MNTFYNEIVSVQKLNFLCEHMSNYFVAPINKNNHILSLNIAY